MLKIIIYTHLLANAKKIKKCSSSKEYNPLKAIDESTGKSPHTWVENFNEAIEVCKTLQKNVQNGFVELGIAEPENYMKFFNEEKNSKKLYRRLEKYQGEYYFDSFSKYAYIIILKQLNSYIKLDMLIRDDITKFYKSETQISNSNTLVFCKCREKFQNSKNFTSEELNELFLRYQINDIYGDFTQRYQNFDVFFTSFSFILYDQIDMFFKDASEINMLRQVTYKIQIYVKDLTGGYIERYNHAQQKYFAKFVTKIDDYFEHKLNDHSYLNKEKKLFKNFSNIFKSINVILKEKNDYKEAQEFNILFIKEFYKNIGFKGKNISNCEVMFGIFIISTIIKHHKEEGTCLSFFTKNAWKSMVKKLKLNVTGLDFIIFSLSEGYFRLLTSHLYYTNIDNSLKNMTKIYYNYNTLIGIVFGDFFDSRERELIIKHLRPIVNNLTIAKSRDVACVQKNYFFYMWKKLTSCCSSSADKFDELNESDSGPYQSNEQGGDSVYSKSTMRLKMFCEILNDPEANVKLYASKNKNVVKDNN